MRALLANDYGQPPSNLEVTEVPDHTPGAGQLLVHIEAAALNPFDVKLITGAMREMVPVTFPNPVGMDGSGTVTSVGGGVSGFSEGDAVVGFFGATPGTVAEYAVIDVGPAVSARPAGLDAVHAAAVPESGMTALTLLRAAELQFGDSVLVVGATGGVGMFIVQLAAADGARVIATGSGDDGAYVHGLGASEVIDYRSADVVEETLRLSPGGVDAVIDLVNMGDGIRTSAGAAREGGRVVSPLGGPDDLGRDVSAVYIGSFKPLPGDLEGLLSQVAEGTLKVEVGRTYTMDESPAAVADFAERHTRGKIVITV
jgi:NADPH:quinone reductase-like Zn-dependent oxidoreductase